MRNKNCEYIAKVPSNIAFIKYWGKRDKEQQWPANSSLSMTLTNCYTLTKVSHLQEAEDHKIYLGDKELFRGDSFATKIFAHLDRLAKTLGQHEKLLVFTENKFPTACGIASSASGLAALTLAAIAAWTESTDWDSLEQKKFSKERLAYLARLGSGSACRSFWEGFVYWDAGASAKGQQVQALFPQKHWNLQDTIILFSQNLKKKPSSQAHLDAWSSLLFKPRLAGLREREEKIKLALENRNIKELGFHLEQEALEMHSVMMTANPPTCYLDDKSSQFISWVKSIRREKGIPVYFTIDAGPNIHIIGEEEAQKLFHHELKKSFPDIPFIQDRVGPGPTLSTLT